MAMAKLFHHLDIDQKLTIITWLFNNCIVMPIEVWWFWLFWVRRKNTFIAQRKPQMLLVALSLFWATYVLVTSHSMLHSFHDDLQRIYGDAINDVLFSISIGEGTTGILFTGISMTRWWLLFFSYLLCCSVDDSWTISISP